MDGSITKRPARVEILAEGIDLTWGDRDKQYGDPLVNMTLAGELKRLIRQYASREIPPAELEALDMALTKISRIVTGAVKRDSYVDGAAYLALAGEMAERASPEAPHSPA